MRFRVLFASGLLAVTTACEKAEDPAVPAATGMAETSSAPQAGVADPAASASAPSDIVSEGGEGIPAGMQGRWGIVPADCTSTRGDAKGLLAIDGSTLRFYESVGTLGEVRERSDSRLHAAFAFMGEGMEWNRDEVLTLEDGGKALVRREIGDEASPVPLRYARC